MRDSAVLNSPLPPSMEKAYHQKCIDLKRRLNEIEDANDAARIRKRRLDRAIMKLRIERTLLLEHLAKAQDLNFNDSDPESSAPATPREHASRVKRTFSRRSPPTLDQQARSIPSPPPVIQSVGYHIPSQTIPRHVFREDEGPLGVTVRNPAGLPKTTPPSEIPQHIEVPQIWYLPIGTNVALLPGSHLPKGRPWTIRDLEPRHHVYPNFDHLDKREQQSLIFTHGYLPYDLFGNAVLCKKDPITGRYRHVFMCDPEWSNPVRNDVRTDAPKTLGIVPESEDDEAAEARRVIDQRAPEQVVAASAPSSPHAARGASVNNGATLVNGTMAGGFTAANRA